MKDLQKKMEEQHTELAIIKRDSRLLPELTDATVLCIFLGEILAELREIKIELSNTGKVKKQVVKDDFVPEVKLEVKKIEPPPVPPPVIKQFELNAETIKALFTKPVEAKSLINEKLVELNSPVNVEKLVGMGFLRNVRKHECSFNEGVQVKAL